MGVTIIVGISCLLIGFIIGDAINMRKRYLYDEYINKICTRLENIVKTMEDSLIKPR